jgi:hypothetical protein
LTKAMVANPCSVVTPPGMKGKDMDEAYALQRLAAIAAELRAIRDYTCDPKSNENPRYHRLSLAVSGMKKAQEDIAAAI